MGASRDSTGVLPQQKLKPKLIVLWAFDRGEDGELHPAFEAHEMPDELRAISKARELSHQHGGVIAWCREADPAEGDYGPSAVLFQHGPHPRAGLTRRRSGLAEAPVAGEGSRSRLMAGRLKILVLNHHELVLADLVAGGAGCPSRD
jgi:hypothetical protein